MKLKTYMCSIAALFCISCSGQKTNEKQVQQSTNQQPVPQVQMMQAPNRQSVGLRTQAAQAMDTQDVKDPVATMQVYQEKYKNLKKVQNTTIANPKSVQLCLLLDTSNSMDGLIDQAKTQLWSIVNELSKCQKNKEAIDFHVALFEYGNDYLERDTGYVRMVSSFTRDLDAISEKLFSLKTNGGSEYCGHVTASALNQLGWNQHEGALKLIYIAGNEPFTQGEVNYKVSCSLANQQEIIINTIYCGDHETGISEGWKNGAIKCKGDYFSIDSNKAIADIETPFDTELIKLNEDLNKTYIYYGQQGKAFGKRQQEQDSNAFNSSKMANSSRVISKSSNLYYNGNWDLVDASKSKDFDITNIDKKTLPDELKKKSEKELLSLIQTNKEKRTKIQKEIGIIAQKRELYIAEKRKELALEDTLGSAIITSMKNQANQKGFNFETGKLE